MSNVKSNPLLGRYRIFYRDGSGTRGRLVSTLAKAKRVDIITPRGKLITTLEFKQKLTKDRKKERIYETIRKYESVLHKAKNKRKKQQLAKVRATTKVSFPYTARNRDDIILSKTLSDKKHGEYFGITKRNLNFKKKLEVKGTTVDKVATHIKTLLKKELYTMFKRGYGGKPFLLTVHHQGQLLSPQGKPMAQQGFSLPRIIDYDPNDEESIDYLLDNFLQSYERSLNDYLSRKISPKFLITGATIEFVKNKKAKVKGF